MAKNRHREAGGRWGVGDIEQEAAKEKNLKRKEKKSHVHGEKGKGACLHGKELPVHSGRRRKSHGDREEEGGCAWEGHMLLNITV